MNMTLTSPHSFGHYSVELFTTTLLKNDRAVLRVLQIKFFGAERSARWILQEAIAFLLDLTCRRDRGGADIENPKW